MHKSWGNAIEFDEAAERMGVDVMRWMYASAAAGGQHHLRLARRRRGAPRAAGPVERLRVLRDLRPAGRLDAGRPRARRRSPTRPAARPLDPVARWPGWRRASRTPGATSTPTRRDAGDLDAFIDDLSTWYLRRVAQPVLAPDERRDRAAAFATLHAALVALARMLAPILPFLTEAMYQNLVVGRVGAGRARQRPPHALADRASWRRSATSARGGDGRSRSGRSTWPGRCAARPASRSASRWPASWLALPGRGARAELEALLDLVADEVNVKAVERDRRRVRARGAAGQAAAAEDRQEARRRDPGGHGRGPRRPSSRSCRMARSTLAGVTLAPDEVEIQATPRPGTAVAHDEGLVVVIDTELTELRAEGDARELQRAIQDLRSEAGPGARRPDRPASDRRRCADAVAAVPRRRCRRDAGRPGRRRARRPCGRRASVALDAEVAASALRRRTAG